MRVLVFFLVSIRAQSRGRCCGGILFRERYFCYNRFCMNDRHNVAGHWW